MMHALAELAKRSVEEFVRNRRTISAPAPLPAELSERAGVFVCIKKGGELRGCIGTFVPCCENIALETIRNAISAATRDPRFRSLSPEELDGLSYTVDVLSPPEKVEDTGGLDPREYGVIVASGNRKGLLLPDLDGVDTVAEQLRIARLKAGILPGEEVEICRFRVRRYT